MMLFNRQLNNTFDNLLMYLYCNYSYNKQMKTDEIEKSKVLQTGQAIILPAYTSNIVKANERFKMISTIIKSGYEGSI